MATNSSIEWTDTTWNPLAGCTKISPGCRHCYAERMSRRLKAMGQPNYANGFKLTLHPDMLTQPLSWRKPRRSTGCSRSCVMRPSTAFKS